MKSKRFNLNRTEKIVKPMKLMLLLAAVFILNHVLFSYKLQVITHPKPNLEENKVVYAEEVQTIKEELGNGQYLFSPFSVTADRSNVFVYDKSQAKVFCFSHDLKLLGDQRQLVLPPNDN